MDINYNTQLNPWTRWGSIMGMQQNTGPQNFVNMNSGAGAANGMSINYDWGHNANVGGMGADGLWKGAGDLLGKLDPKYGSAIGGLSNVAGLGSQIYGMWESHNRSKMMKELMDKQYNLALANYDAQAQSYNDQAKITNTGLRMGGFGTQIRGQKNSKNQIA